MNAPRGPRLFDVIQRLYGWLLYACPRAFRTRFGPEMRQVLRDVCRDAWRARGAPGLLREGGRACLDLLSVAAKERGHMVGQWLGRSWDTCVFVFLALTLGLLAGWLDVRNTEVQVAAGGLFVFGFVLGALRPARAWLWALLLGLCMPLSLAVARWRQVDAAWPIGWRNVAESALAVVPALLGAYGGALGRWIFNRSRSVET